MRTTVIERLNCRREVPYDENNHSILLRDGNIQYDPETIAEGLLKIRIKFSYQLKERDGDKVWGVIEGEAVTTIQDKSIKPWPDGKGAEVGDNIGLVVQGAISDDIFLPISQVIHAMRLPVPLIMPSGGAESPKAPPVQAEPPATPT